MKTFTKILAPAAIAAAAIAVAVPASAQVQGRIATADVSRAIISTTALQTAYNQIGTTYATQLQTRQTKQQELSTLLQPFDQNGNNQLDDAELPAVQSSPNFTKIQTLESEIAGLNAQVTNARIFAVEQILAQYPTVLQDFATAQQIQVVLQPEAIQFAVEGADITAKLTTALNTKLPSVGIVPPEGYRPTRQGAQIFQEIQQTLLAAQMIQQQQAAQQQQQSNQPQGR